MKIALAALALSACVSAAHPAQVVQLGPSPAPPWSSLRDAIAGCAQMQGISGDLKVRVDIDDDGGAGQVSADRGGGDLAACIGRSLVSVRFRDHRGVAIEVPYSIATQPQVAR